MGGSRRFEGGGVVSEGRNSLVTQHRVHEDAHAISRQAFLGPLDQRNVVRSLASCPSHRVPSSPAFNHRRLIAGRSQPCYPIVLHRPLFIMKVSTTLGWKQLASTFHPPLPINRRDSHRLLGLLNTSFDQALEREHPRVSPTGRNTTEEHLHQILSSPHFSGAWPRASSTRTASSPLRVKQSLVDKITASTHAFKESVAAGSMTVERAKQYLDLAYRLLLSKRNLHQATEIEVLKSLKVGSTVANYLWSAGLTQSPDVLRDPVLLERLFGLLVTEGQSETVIQWLAQLRSVGLQASTEGSVMPPMMYNGGNLLRSFKALDGLLFEMSQSQHHTGLRTFPAYRKALECTFPLKSHLKVWRSIPAQRLMLSRLITSVDQYGLGLGAAMQVFIRLLQPMRRNTEELVTLRPAARYIVKRLLQSTSTSQLDPSVYDKFMNARLAWSMPGSLDHAVLMLRHPQGPSTGAACSWLENTNHLEKNRERYPKDQTLHQKSLLLGLTTADVLLSGGERDIMRARNLMNTLKKHFAAELGELDSSTSLATEKSHSIASYLKLLKHQFGRSLLLGKARHDPEFAVF